MRQFARDITNLNHAKKLMRETHKIIDPLTDRQLLEAHLRFIFHAEHGENAFVCLVCSTRLPFIEHIIRKRGLSYD